MNRRERRNKKVNILDNLIQVIKQYFPELISKFNGLTDKRNQSYVRYEMKVIFIVRLMGLMCEIKTMQGLSREFNTKEAIENIATICGLELDEIPHADTINDVFENIEVTEIEKIIKYIITKMIRSKMLDKYRIRNRYFHIVVDGTGLATSRKQYNENCLIKNKTDKNGNKYQEYSTYVLEAKLVVGNMVFSIGSEFVENIKGEKRNISKEEFKNDCEIKAFKRLANKIKKEYPRLPIVIGGDALYACKTVLDICKENRWKYIVRLKEGRIPTLYREFEIVVKDNNESKKNNYEFTNKLDYQCENVNIVRYKENEENREFIFMTNFQLDNKNIESTVSLGRKRWKIENEGFNIQKNETFDICHLYSKNQTAIKVHYLMIQIAHILRQLIELGLKDIKEMGYKKKEISQSIKNMLISTITVLKVHSKVQLRFD